MLKGADVSGHQGPDWQPANDDSFCLVKATEGSTYFSQDSIEQLKTVRSRNMLVGHYHFMVPGNAARQAAWFAEKADVQPGDLIACDWELHKEGHPSVEDAAEFIAETQRRFPNNRVLLYCNKSDWLNTEVKAPNGLWIAHYTTMAEPGIASRWALWQHSKTPIDQNKAASRFSTLTELRAWAKTNEAFLYNKTYNGDYVTFAGGKVTPIDREILKACSHASGWGTIRLSQGGLSTSVSASAYTHAGLAAGDIAIDGRSRDAVWNLSAHLIRSGIIAFPRGFGGDNFPPHIHFASVESQAHAHQQLKDQIAEYKRGGDGLVGDKPYNGPAAKLGTWDGSPDNPANITPDMHTYYVNTNVLNGRDADGNIIVKRTLGYVIQAAKQVRRWGRQNVVTAGETYYALDYLKAAT